KADGVDFVASPRHVLFGHHFTSVAGAAPIVGPAIAVIWGWLPAVLWVVFGTIFIGAVHDYGCLVVSAKNDGRSIGDLTAPILSKRARLLFLAIVLFLAWIVLAVFAYVIADLFTRYPATVLPINFEIIIAPIIGWLAYKKKVDLLIPSLVALVLLVGMIWLGTKYPIVMPDLFGIPALNIWIGFLLVYAFTASVLPVWSLLQPRDLINSHKLFLGLGLMYFGLLVVHPPMTAPALNLNVPDGPAWFPFLFITIACGAVSGFHGLVSSGTTSKQLDKLSDARPIGYGAMLGEGSLALMSVLACTAGFKSLSAWQVHYQSWANAKGLGAKIGAFVEGGSRFMTEGIGLPEEFAQAAIAVIVISFAATTLDTATRIQRYIISELGDAYRFPALRNRFVASGLAASSPLLLVYGGNWKALWPMFGATNQMLAGLCLIVLSVYLALKKKPYGFVLAPMLFLTTMTSVSMAISLVGFLRTGQVLLAGLSLLLLGLSAAMLWEAWCVFARLRSANQKAAPIGAAIR
ncbi:MAG: carbon starvation protein A, partial [Elusimicrobia bacterium]